MCSTAGLVLRNKTLFPFLDTTHALRSGFEDPLKNQQCPAPPHHRLCHRSLVRGPPLTGREDRPEPIMAQKHECPAYRGILYRRCKQRLMLAQCHRA